MQDNPIAKLYVPNFADKYHNLYFSYFFYQNVPFMRALLRKASESKNAVGFMDKLEKSNPLAYFNGFGGKRLEQTKMTHMWEGLKRALELTPGLKEQCYGYKRWGKMTFTVLGKESLLYVYNYPDNFKEILKNDLFWLGYLGMGSPPLPVTEKEADHVFKTYYNNNNIHPPMVLNLYKESFSIPLALLNTTKLNNRWMKGGRQRSYKREFNPSYLRPFKHLQDIVIPTFHKHHFTPLEVEGLVNIWPDYDDWVHNKELPKGHLLKGKLCYNIMSEHAIEVVEDVTLKQINEIGKAYLYEAVNNSVMPPPAFFVRDKGNKTPLFMELAKDLELTVNHI